MSHYPSSLHKYVFCICRRTIPTQAFWCSCGCKYSTVDSIARSVSSVAILWPHTHVSACLCVHWGLTKWSFVHRGRRTLYAVSAFICAYSRFNVATCKFSMTYGRVYWSCEVHAYSLCTQNAVINTTLSSYMWRKQIWRGDSDRDEREKHRIHLQQICHWKRQRWREICLLHPSSALLTLRICSHVFMQGKSSGRKCTAKDALLAEVSLSLWFILRWEF